MAQTLVWDRESGLHGGGGRPTEALAGFYGHLRVGWHLCEKVDPQAEDAVERVQEFIETTFEPGRAFVNELDFQLQLDTWFDCGRTRGWTRRCGPGRGTVCARSAKR